MLDMIDVFFILVITTLYLFCFCLGGAIPVAIQDLCSCVIRAAAVAIADRSDCARQIGAPGVGDERRRVGRRRCVADGDHLRLTVPRDRRQQARLWRRRP